LAVCALFILISMLRSLGNERSGVGSWQTGPGMSGPATLRSEDAPDPFRPVCPRKGATVEAFLLAAV
jgi:hypothetical protein